MIDPQVAFDKLAQFTCASELADYFRSINVKGERGKAFECPISNYFKMITGRRTGVTVNYIAAGVTESGVAPFDFESTNAMKDFIIEFDVGNYQDLVS